MHGPNPQHHLKITIKKVNERNIVIEISNLIKLLIVSKFTFIRRKSKTPPWKSDNSILSKVQTRVSWELIINNRKH